MREQRDRNRRYAVAVFALFVPDAGALIAGNSSAIVARAAGIVSMPVRRLPVLDEIQPASHGRTEPPTPAVARIHRVSAVRGVRAKNNAITIG